MAVGSNPVTFAQHAILSNEPMVAAVTMSLIDNGSVLARDIPFLNKATMVVNGVQWQGNLPTVNWSKINEDPEGVVATPTPYQEQIYIIRNTINVDKIYVQDVNAIVDPRAAQVQAYLQSVAYDFNDKFINNSHPSGDVDAIVGLRARLNDPATYNVKNSSGTAEAKIDASATMTTSATAAQFGAFTEKIDQLLWAVGSPTGQGVVLYMNEVMKRRWEMLARLHSGSGGFAQATDQLGRTVDMYKGAQLQDIGYKADQTTRIITTTETNAGVDGASTYTSIYAVNYGGAAGLIGWQYDALTAKDLGVNDNGVNYRTLIDWAGGLYPQSNRCIGRAYDINLG